ncbi:MAG TPA: hypothetical protein VJV05_13975 [Pyrinomonadaceae bacterium]|nr:hypothetical protein [Pyrinomonadaceae bacterium]
MPDLMTRYWFVMETGLGIGITAYSIDDAKALIETHKELLLTGKVLSIVENVDVRTLDQGHVIPNMGPPNVRGVWSPNLL